MQEYDVVLKLLLRESAQRTLKQITGLEIARWLPVELPKIQNPRIDLLGETLEKLLIHFGLQSRNDSTMPLRMAE